jgi:murein DD-endopeptidase MepM/ murein hydrolase activator NlpD
MAHVFVLLFVAALALLQSASDDGQERVAKPDLPLPAPVASAPRATGPQERRSAADELLAARQLVVPVAGIPRHKLKDTFEEPRGTSGRTHKAIDIMAPWGTPVLAADEGKVAKISRNRGGGLAIYQVDPSGRLVYYYAHLAGYADGLKEGQLLQRGDLIGYVGTTGNAPDSAPHLHFSVQLVSVEGRLWKGEPINPYDALVGGEPVARRP